MPGPIQLFKDSLALVSANIFLYVSILLLPIVVLFLTVLFAPNPATGVLSTLEMIIYVILMFVYVVVNIAMTVALILAITDSSMTVKEAYSRAMPYFWRYIGLSILMSIILMVGFLLLIIPGIIMSVWFAFASFVLILEQSTIVESLKKSREYVRGKWWAIFGRLVVMSILVTLMAMVISLIGVFMPNNVVTEAIVTSLTVLLTPIAMAYVYLLYTAARGSTGTTPNATIPPSAIAQ